MVEALSEMARTLWFLASVLTFFTDANTTGYAGEQKGASAPHPPAASQTIDRWWVSKMGEIRAVPTADGSKLKCSEVLDLGRAVRIKSIDIYRSAYVLDVSRKAFGDAAPLMRVPQRSSTWSPGWREFDGKNEMILGEWECRFPPTKDVYMVVSLAVVRLSDGPEEVCRFRPLLIANGSVVARAEDMAQEMQNREGRGHKPDHR